MPSHICIVLYIVAQQNPKIFNSMYSSAVPFRYIANIASPRLYNHEHGFTEISFTNS